MKFTYVNELTGETYTVHNSNDVADLEEQAEMIEKLLLKIGHPQENLDQLFGRIKKDIDI